MYVSNSSRLNDKSLPDPTVTSNMLTYRLGDVADKWVKTLRFKAKIDPKGDSRELLTKGVLIFDTPAKKKQRTPLVENILLLISEEERMRQEDKVFVLVPETEPIAHKNRRPFQISEETQTPQSAIVLHPQFAVFSSELNPKDRAMLGKLVKKLKPLEVTHVAVTGHTDSTPIRARSRHIYADNYALSLARAWSVGKYIAENLDLDLSRLSILGKGPDEPVAANQTKAGRALNRRVTVKLMSAKITQDINSHKVSDIGNNSIYGLLSNPLSEKEKATLDDLLKKMAHLEVTRLFITYVVRHSNTLNSGAPTGRSIAIPRQRPWPTLGVSRDIWRKHWPLLRHK